MRSIPTTPGGTQLKTRVQYSPSPSSPDMVTHVANHNLPHDLDTFCTYMDNAYLQHCDAKIPHHYFALMMTKQALSKLRVIDFLCKGVSTDTLDQTERDALFIEAIKTVEYDNIIQRTDSLQGFRWYTYQHFPFPAHIFLISELRQRTTGDLCERAWSAMTENHERRGLTRNLRSPLHIAVGHFLVKAWDAREAAALQMGLSLAVPKVITMLRNQVSRFKRPAAASSNGTGASSMPQQSSNSAGAHGGQVGGGSSAPPELYTAGKPLQDPAPQLATSGAMAGAAVSGAGMTVDDTMMFGGFDGSVNHQLFGPSTLTPDGDFSHMDWNYLVACSSFGGFNPNVYSQVPGQQHGSVPGGQ